jgi:hypothetical protein
MASKGTHFEFQLGISQLALKFEGVTNKSIGEFLWFSVATKLEEGSEVVKNGR